MDFSRQQAIHNILLSSNTKWNRRIRYPKSWWKVYNNINIWLKKFSGELFAKLEKDDLELDEVVSGLGKVDLCDIPNGAIAALNREMENVVQSMNVTDEQASNTVEVIVADLNNVLKQYGFIKNEWSTYGSYKTGLCCIDSDVDLYFENIERTNTATNIPQSIARCLKKSTSLFSDLHYIKNARIPIIKLKHISTGKECDISFCKSGVISSTLNKFYIELNPSVKIFTLYLKLLLKKYRLYGTNRMTTHVIFWLVVFFFQQKKLLPPVKNVRKKYADCEKTDLLENWNCSLKENVSYSFSTQSNCLSALLFDFAKFYKDFNFIKNVISPYLGCTIPIEKLSKWRIPDEILPLDLQRYNSDDKNPFYRHVINLQEPSILSSNLAKNVVFKVVNFFKIFCNELLLSFKMYSLSDEFLTEILPMELPLKNTLPRDLMQCTSIKFNFRDTYDLISGNLEEYLCRAIHGIMGAALQFELKNKAVEDIFEVEYSNGSKVPRVITKPAIYLNYSSTAHTWDNANVRKLLLFPNKPGNLNEGVGRSINVCFVGIIYPHDGEARIMIQTDMYLLRFLHKYVPLMLRQTIFAQFFSNVEQKVET